jgi:hypothetical protein
VVGIARSDSSCLYNGAGRTVYSSSPYYLYLRKEVGGLLYSIYITY